MSDPAKKRDKKDVRLTFFYLNHCLFYSEAIPRLRQVIEGPHGRGCEGQLIQDDIPPLENCISAIGKILRAAPELVGSQTDHQQLMQAWLSWLPVTEDKEESVHVYGYVCELIQR